MASLVAQRWRIYLQCRRRKRCGFDPWVGKIPWRRAWQLIPENPMNRGAWCTMVHEITQSRTWLMWLTTHTHTHTIQASGPLSGRRLGNLLQCSCLENPRDGGAWWAAVYGVTQSWIQLKRLSSRSRKASFKSQELCLLLWGRALTSSPK